MYTQEGYSVNPDAFYTPKISISPYNLKVELGKIEKIDQEFFYSNKIFTKLGSNIKLSKSGKDAIVRIFNESELRNANLIAIVTVSGNTYVSRCITNTLNKVLHKTITTIEQAEVIYIIHEFGRILSTEKMDELRKLNKIILNDFAYSFSSLYLGNRQDFYNEINFTSFPKAFPVNSGGIYSIPNSLKLAENDSDQTEINIFADPKLFTSEYLQVTSIKRKENLCNIIRKLQKIGAKNFWNDDDYVPGVAMLTLTNNIQLENLKLQLNRVGIESSVFYGENAFFVPVHQNLTELEIDYITSFVKYYAAT
jgi:hypothetical protein